MPSCQSTHLYNNTRYVSKLICFLFKPSIKITGIKSHTRVYHSEVLSLDML